MKMWYSNVSPLQAIAIVAALAGAIYLYWSNILFESHMTMKPISRATSFNGATVADIPGKGKGVIATRDIAVSFLRRGSAQRY